MFCHRYISQLLLSICCFASLQADFVTLSVWERTLPSGEKQHVICCGDDHDLTAQADEQANDLVKFMAERKCESDVIIVEDLLLDLERLDFEGIVQFRKQYKAGFTESTFEVVQDTIKQILDTIKPLLVAEKVGKSALFQVGTHADRHRIRVINADHRCDNLPVPAAVPVKLQALVHKISCFILSNSLEELGKYDDNCVLNQFYEDIVGRYANTKEMLQRQVSIKEIENAMPFDQVLGTEHPLYEELVRGPDTELFREIKHLLPRLFTYEEFFAEVVDAKCLHNIYQLQMQQEQSNLITVCAGAAHTVNIERVLPKLGYERIGNKGSSIIISFKSIDSIISSYKSMDSMMPISIKSSLDSIFSDRSISALPSKRLQAKL